MNPHTLHTTGVTDGPLCQVDDRHGCSACCGLFNHACISEESLTAFLMTGADRARTVTPVRNFTEVSLPVDIRDTTTWICPYQGFMPRGDKPGCLYHPALNRSTTGDLRDRSLYGARICSEYFCAAHTILDARMRSMLIACTDGWYPYTIAIIDPDSYLWIARAVAESCDEAGTRWSENRGAGAAVSKSLRLHGAFLNSTGSPVFHYSIEEYRRCSKAYSLAGSPARMREVLEIIRSELSGPPA